VPPAESHVRAFVLADGEARPVDGKGRKIVSTHRFVVKDGKVIEASGTPGTTVLHSCDARGFEASASSSAPNTKQSSHFFLCTDGAKSNAQFADMLESSLKGIEADPKMDAENKSKIVARLRAKIAELRAK